MSQCTLFCSDKELFLKLEELYLQLNLFHNDEIWLDDIEELQLLTEIDVIYEKLRTDYYNLFRTNKRNEDGSYIDEVIFSRKECFEWIEKPENFVSFEMDKGRSLNLLNEFWDKYPDGVIYFG